MVASPDEETLRAAGYAEHGIVQLVKILSRKLPDSYLKERLVGKKSEGRKVKYIPWTRILKILDKYSPGWQWEVSRIHNSDDRLYVVGRLTLFTKDGPVSRDGVGTEMLKRTDKNTGEIEEIAYGNPSSNAEANALRRAAAKFGLGLYLKYR